MGVSLAHTPLSVPSASLPEWPGRYSWVRVVWLKVIQRAMFDFILWKKAKSLTKRRDSDSARKWLFEESYRDYSFHNVCKLFGFPIEDLRLRASKLTVKDVKKMEHIDRQREKAVTETINKPDIVVDLYSYDERLLRRRLLEFDNSDGNSL